MRGKMSHAALLPIMLTVGFMVVGQVLIKLGVMQAGPSPADLREFAPFLGRAMTNPRVILGLGCAVLAAVSWVTALSRTDLSLAYPFTGLTIVLVMVMSSLVLREGVPLTRWLGAVVVCLGIWLASR